MAATLLTLMLMIPYICDGALLRKSTAMDFLQKTREKRDSECYPRGCSSEARITCNIIKQVTEASTITVFLLARNEERERALEGSLWRMKDLGCSQEGKSHTTMLSAAGPDGAGAAPGNRRLQQTQAQVDEVVDIMRVNVDKVLERDQKLSELDDRADALQAGASQFETSAAKLKRKYWWKNCKMWGCYIWNYS
ncbi:Vesicle-associated membrane protein 3 [Dissostichus eleginoides]|uniref:Vesicle-associated membrane protein 3 n=1 Tax=Dissostichus eleginoides TaxID=100907 RepID=A0AAD9CH62_DISEL|nr:Vesicle-associated membrane protein 3 [Dissostichus eleginoides]